MTTGVVDFGSELERKAWVREGLLQKASTSFWSRFTGRTKESVVFQEANISASDGHNVVFDFDGNLSGKAIKGKKTARGKGEQKRKFSNTLTVERYRLVVDNGDKFDGVNIGDLSINEHEDSRSKLGDLFIRFKDQALYDAAQGFKDSVAPTHSIQIVGTTSVSYNDLAVIELALRTGTGYKTGAFGSVTAAAKRAPLQPFIAIDGKPAWLFVVDAFTAKAMRVDSTMQTLLSQGDMRGPDNRVWTGVLGRIGQLVIVEAATFFGVTDTGTGLDASNIEVAGMRVYDATNSKWQGQTGFDAAAASRYSRNLILGAGALQLGMGMMPEYRFKFSDDFDITSESALEVWMETQKTNLLAENTDYTEAKLAGQDYSVIAVDVKIA
jgi:hypothetical protein